LSVSFSDKYILTLLGSPVLAFLQLYRSRARWQRMVMWGPWYHEQRRMFS